MTLSIAAKRNASNEYWAAVRQSNEFALNAIERIQRYRRWLDMSGRGWRMMRAWRTFYGYAPDGTGDTSYTAPAGAQGEWLNLTTNGYGTLVQQTMARLTDTKTTFKAVANNTDYRSLTQADLANGIMEDYARRLGIEEREYEAKLLAVIASEGWLVRSWDANAGDEVVDSPDGAVGKAGDARCYSLSPFDVAYDGDTQDTESLDWLFFRRRYNRFHLAAQLEAKAEKLAAMPAPVVDPNADPEADPKPTPQEMAKRYTDAAEQLRNMVSADMAEVWTDAGFDLKNRHVSTYDTTTSPDLVWVWECRVLPSPALPDGRLVRFVTDLCVLYDSAQPDATGAVGAYPYRSLQADKISPEVVIGTVSGHTAHFDLLALQECMDNTATQMASAANVGGVMNMWVEGSGDKSQGPNLTVSQLDGSMNLLTSAKKPERLEGITIDPQAVGFMGFVKSEMRERVGQNEVSMGEPSKGMPAQAMALLEAKTVQFHNKLARESVKLDTRNRTGLLEILQDFATSPEGEKRVAEIAGKSGAYKMVEWCGDDLGAVSRFRVEEVAPELSTQAGRSAVLDMLVGKRLISDPKMALTFYTTGNLETTYEWDEANLQRIQMNREMLMKGIGLPPVDPVQSKQQNDAWLASGRMGPAPLPIFVDDGQPHIRPLMVDTPWVDIKEYAALLKAPGVRDNPAVVKAVLDTLHYLKAMWRQMDPLDQLLYGCPPELVQQPPQPPSIAPAGAPGETSGTNPPAPGRTSHTPQPPIPGQPAGAPGIRQPTMPRPPPNPINGTQAPSPMQEPQ